jgi:hypothetical protein
MLSNNAYNLLEQIVEESKSLWRIREHYKKDAPLTTDCLAFWNKLQGDKEEHIRELKTLIKAHID